MELWRIAVRAIVAYAYLLAMTRASGKRVIQQASPFDFLVALILGDLIDDGIWAEVPAAKFATAVGSIVACDLLVKLAAFYSPLVFRIVNGTPRVLLRNGVEDRRELRRQQLNDSDLAHLLRRHGVEERDELQTALLEEGADVSAIKKHDAQPATKQDANRVKEMLR